MKNFSDFIKEEITIKGNAGLPGEENKNEPSYLGGVERRGQEKIRGIRDPRPLFGEIMGLMGRTKGYSDGHEKELEELAEDMIRAVYSGILDNVDLDIKFVKDGNEVAQFMEEEEEEEKEAPPVVSKDRNLKLEVDKRKLANNIIQGEAKNTKFIIEMPECKDGLKKILGDRRGEEYHRVLIDISKVADKLDWIIPIEAKADMMEQAPEGMAGACSVKWPDKDKEEKEEKQKSAEEILKDIENGGDLDDNKEEIEELLSSGNPIIKARGVDFAMLIHETVKGIYELISSAGIPKDEKIARNVMLNTSSFEDEAEDFKYGPFIAADLRDFINKAPNIDKYPNIREHVYGKLISMPAEEFLRHMKNILLNSPEGRHIIDELVLKAIAELDKYERDITSFDAKQKLGELEGEEREREPEHHEEEEEEEVPPLIVPREEDYAKMSQRELQAEIDAALDAGDYEKVGKMSKFLKEGKEIYLKELQRINESHNRRNK